MSKEILPGEINPYSLPVVAADRNRWFFVTLVLALVIVFLAMDNIRLRRARSDIDLAWVRVFPDGSSDVSFNDVPNQPEFFESTVNSVLGRWVKARYGLNAATIRADYGFARELMSPDQARRFVAPGGFNAPKKAAEAIACGARCARAEVKIRNVEHYEKINNALADGSVYRSNVYIETVEYAGEHHRTVEKAIVTLEWRILSKDEILAKYPDTRSNRNMLAYLRSNPAAIEIMSYSKLVDPSDSNNPGKPGEKGGSANGKGKTT